MSLGDGNADLWGLDVVTAFADTNPGCTIGSASAKPLEEAGTIARASTTFMATDGLAEVGGEERAFAQWKVEWEAIGIRVRPGFMCTQGR